MVWALSCFGCVKAYRDIYRPKKGCVLTIKTRGSSDLICSYLIHRMLFKTIEVEGEREGMACRVPLLSIGSSGHLSCDPTRTKYLRDIAPTILRFQHFSNSFWFQTSDTVAYRVWMAQCKAKPVAHVRPSSLELCMLLEDLWLSRVILKTCRRFWNFFLFLPYLRDHT